LAEYHLTAVVWQEEGQYVSQCPELCVASCGRDAADAVKSLQKAVEMYLGNAKRLYPRNHFRDITKMVTEALTVKAVATWATALG
jgi:hypothetical protein